MSKRITLTISLALVAVGMLLALASHADTTVVPMGEQQAQVRDAYRDAFTHLYAGERVRWAASTFTCGGVTCAPGTFIMPDGIATAAGHVDLTGTLHISRAYALRPGRIALLRSNVTVGEGEEQMVAVWELSEIRQLLDGYLFGALPYQVLDESQIAEGGLQGYDLLIVPAIRADAVYRVVDDLDESGALSEIRAFVEAGGTLYAQGTGAYVAEAAGLLPEGTVDLSTSVVLVDEDEVENRGRMDIRQADSPLAYSWLTDTLYALGDPLLHPTEDMDVVAVFVNAVVGGEPPAIVRAPAGRGQVIAVAGHPTDDARRVQSPLFFDAVLLALASRAELYGDAIQTFNPAYDPHQFPAYERVPVSATLVAANLWDAPLHNVVITEQVSAGYVVSASTVSPAPEAIHIVTEPTTQTLIVWNLGTLAAGEVMTLSYIAESDPNALAAGVGTFSIGRLHYDDPQLGPVEVSHRPFILTAQMAARLVGDRDLEADRHYRIPGDGIYLDVALPLENKEWTLAHNVVVTDWVYLIYPFVDYENQHVILSTNDGQTVWMRNEPFLWGSKYPLWEGATSPTQTITLADWRAMPADERHWCVFTSTYGIHTDPPSLRSQGEDYGSFITIPLSYTDAITVTADHKLLLPCIPLRWDLGDWPGYWYEEPAVRYGVHSRELFSRTVVFHGTPREGTLVIPNDAGSVYVNAGSDPVPFREYLTAAVPYAAAAPAPAVVTWQDVWSRTHELPLRASFYDVWDWDSCATCRLDRDQHAAINLTFGMYADLDGDGAYEAPVREIPTRLSRTRLILMGKTINRDPNDTGVTIPANQNLIDLPVFHGLGVRIEPENDTWDDSWWSPLGRTELVSVSEGLAYDHLYFQQDIPLGSWEVFYVSATISTYDMNREGMFKLHDGARLVYRQMAAGPNRYEIYDSHVHSVIGLSSDGQVSKRVGPTLVSIYGDRLYYLFTVRDRYDPRTFDADPYMNSWGYGDFVATTYVGGRKAKTLFHSIVHPGEHTRLRVSLDNNTGVTLTNVVLGVNAPAGITVTLLYTDPATAPEPIWPELAFLNADTIPDAWRGVYYFDLQIGNVDPALRGQVVEIPIVLTADGLPDGYRVPPARLAIVDDGGDVPQITYGPARDLTLSDTLPANIALLTATLVTAAEGESLLLAADYDAVHPPTDTAALVFESFTHTVPFTIREGTVSFALPQEWRTLPAADGPLYVAACATITRAHHGPNVVNEGPTITYVDPFGVRWSEQGEQAVVEAHGAAVWADYYCEGGWDDSGWEGSEEVETDGGECIIPPDGPSEIVIRITAYNEGDAIARGVTFTLDLPSWVEPVEAFPTWVYTTSSSVVWSLGDLAPGAWRTFRIVLWVNPSQVGDEWRRAAVADWQLTDRVLVVRRSEGEFLDATSQTWVRGQVGDEFAVRVGTKIWHLYLPNVLRNYKGSWWPQSGP